MLGRGRKSKSANTKVDTIIGQQTRIEGSIYFTGGLHIDGSIRGSVHAEAGSTAVLTISEQGRIEGDVQVPTIILNGSVKGDVHSDERIELGDKARVDGNVFYHLIEMAMGAEVNGNLVHRKEADSSVVSFDRDATESVNGLD